MTTKLIRDRVVDLPWRHEAFKAAVRPAHDETEVDRLLRCKLLEEVAEFLEAPTDRAALEEAADVLEVLLALVSRSGYAEPFEKITDRMHDKRRERGGFEHGLVLEIS